MQWQPIETAPEDVMVLTKIDDEKGVRNEQSLVRRRNLWWTGRGGNAMYVYYRPTHWMPLPDSHVVPKESAE